MSLLCVCAIPAAPVPDEIATSTVAASALATRALSRRAQSVAGPFASFYRSIVTQAATPTQAAEVFASGLGMDLASQAYRGEDPVTA